MKILLVHPPVNYQVPLSFRAEGLGVAYIASVLRRDGHDVELLDAHCRCLNLKQTISEILSRDFDALGITATDDHSKALIAIVSAVRSRRKEAIICAGGYLPSLSLEQVLRACPGLDFVVRGEGETSASAVFRTIEGGQDWRESEGIAFLQDGKIRLNPMPPLIEDLDSLPYPARDAILQAPPGIGTSVGVCTSRGCYHRCSFCCIGPFYGLHGRKPPRFRQPVKVVDEIQDATQRTGVNAIHFVDDDFLGPGEKTRARAKAIAQEIIDRRLGVRFTLECRADEVDEETLGSLKEAGLTEVFLGIESMLPRALETFNKRTTVEQNLAAIELVRKVGVKLRAGYIMFDPYTTFEELQEQLKAIKELGIDKEAAASSAPFVTQLALFRGTPIVDKVRADGLLIEDGFKLAYRFRDPLMGIIFRGSVLLSSASQALGKLKRRG